MKYSVEHVDCSRKKLTFLNSIVPRTCERCFAFFASDIAIGVASTSKNPCFRTVLVELTDDKGHRKEGKLRLVGKLEEASSRQ